MMNTKVNKEVGMTGGAQRRIALVAGFSLLVMVVAIGLAEGMAMTNILVPGDTAMTINNITAQEGLFRFGIFSHLVVVILDIEVAWAFIYTSNHWMSHFRF